MLKNSINNVNEELKTSNKQKESVKYYVNDEEHEVSAPQLAIVPIQNLAIDDVNISFSMEVKGTDHESIQKKDKND